MVRARLATQGAVDISDRGWKRIVEEMCHSLRTFWVFPREVEVRAEKRSSVPRILQKTSAKPRPTPIPQTRPSHCLEFELPIVNAIP